MEAFVQDLLKNNKNDGSASIVLDPQFNDSADDGGRRTVGVQMDSMLEQVDKWQQRLEIYMEDEEDDLRPDEWKALEGSLTKFHNDVLKRYAENAGEGLHSIPSDLYASEAIEAIRLMKRIKWKVTDAFDEICFDDAETEVKRILNKLVDKAVLSVDGGRPFERTEIDWVDPSVDQEFNKELYEFASANKSLPDAQAIDWLPPVPQDAPKLLPRDVLKRLTTPLKIDDVDDHEDWEHSATHPPDEEESYERFEGPFQQLRKNLKDVLTSEILSYANNVDTTASIDPAVVEVASKRLKAGEMGFDFKSMIILPYDANHCKLVGVRDDSVGDMLTYKEVLKPPSERIMDQKLQNDPGSWLDPERPAGPRVRTFGWEPLADLKEDLPCDETEIVKKKPNPDALAAGSALSSVAKERAELINRLLKEKCAKAIEEKKFSCDDVANPSIKDYLQRKGQSFGIIPDNFDTPEDFLDSLDMPILREKDAGKAFPLEDEVLPLDPDWLGLDGSGPHVQLTEELYWNQLQSFKKPLTVPSVDWKALLDQDVSEDEDGANTAELKRYLAEATEPLTKDAEDLMPDVSVKPPEAEDLTKSEKDTPARKRALDKEFVREWIDKFGSDEGIQGLDPKNFKPPEHLVSSEEYEEKFLTHPYTSSYVFHPNFVRFRRMTRNHPTYSEYTFKKLESNSTLATEENLREFKNILSDLDKDGPQIPMDGTQQINEKTLCSDADQARKWEMEFSAHMTEGLKMLNSFAETSRAAYSKPRQPCKEEMSEDLIFGHVEKQELPGCKEFRLQPFCLEDFPKFPAVGATNDVVVSKEKPKTRSASPDSDSESEDSDGEVEVPQKDIPWRPFKTFNSYRSVNVLQLLFDACQLIETSSPKCFHPPPRVSAWIQGKYQPSTIKLKKWRKLYGSLFPEVDSPLKTPYLFLTEEERLDRLRKSDTKECPNPDGPWSLTEEERLSLENPPEKAEEIDKVQDDAGEDRVSLMEQRSGIVVQSNKNTQKWAVELDTSEAPDMSVLGTPAMEFMFQLDNFQKQAIMALEKGYNVFVSAHTSAGKTVVAEYAIAMSRKRRSRAIYTSPIKALSNQKYNDFKKCFDSVGLITGDVQLNERADCLIMTTEILRSMLYNSSEGIRDLEFVVLDEVHYMNDRERGHVWEEVLILLPANVQIVMLSATVPNAMEFASWVGRNKQRKVKVCRTLHRPVPLKHYFHVGFPGKLKPAEGLFLLRDGDGPVLAHVWKDIQNLIESVEKATNSEKKAAFRKLAEKRAIKGKNSEGKDYMDPGSSGGYNKKDAMTFYHKKEKARWSQFVLYLKDSVPSWLPTIVFAFSRKKCDELANLLKEIDLTTPEEKLCIKVFIQSQVAKLDEEDRNLPQIRILRGHLIRGIGVHHSGILPVLKEIVELLFQEGKVKLLLATETFAMGVNMPARTVVFYSIMKFDGDEKRFLLPAEYIQMAGRAGRRGEDTVGNVIISYHPRDTVRSISTIEAMMTGSPQTLESQFRVSYRMILRTLTARSHITAENMMRQSYHENNEQTKYFLLEDSLRSVNDMESKQRTVINSRYPKDYVDQMREMYDIIDEYLAMWSKLRVAESTTTKFLKDVHVGKLIKFRCGPIPAAIGVVMKVIKEPLQFLVMGLRNFDRNAILEPHPHIDDSARWFNFLSVLPHPKGKTSDGDIDKRLLTYTIDVSDILVIYKDSACVTEDNASQLMTSAHHFNMGGRSSGFPSENGTVVVGDSYGHPLNLFCMPCPSPRNLSPSDPGIEASAGRRLFPDSSQTSCAQTKEFPNSSQPSSPASPGNDRPPTSVLCGSNVDVTFSYQHKQRELAPLFNSMTKEVNAPRFERSQSVPGVNQPVSHQHPLIGQPLMYPSNVPPRFFGFIPNQMYRPDFNVPNRNFGHNEMLCHVSPQNVPPWSNHSAPYASQSNRFHTPMNLAPVGVLHHQNHPGFRLLSPNLEQVHSNHGNEAICRPPLLENETEFPKLGSRLEKDKKSKSGSRKPRESAASLILPPEASQERGNVNTTTCDERFGSCGSKSHTRIPESSHLLRQTSCPGSVSEGFPTSGGVFEQAVQSCGGSSSRSTIISPYVQECGPYPSNQPLPRVLVYPPPHAAAPSPAYLHPLGLCGVPQPTVGSQVSRSPSLPPPIPAACLPNYAVPHSFGPPNPFWRPPFPPNPTWVYGPRNMTKSNSDLEAICYQLHSRLGLKPVDEAALAKECDLELYDNVKTKQEEMKDFIQKFYPEQSRAEFIEAFAIIFHWLETVRKKGKLQKYVAEKTMTLYPEYSSKIEILKKMNYVADDSVVQMKGYMAARISKCELVITEMLVRNVIKDLTPEEVAGLMSFIVYQPTTKDQEEEDEKAIAEGRPNLQNAIQNTLAIIEDIKSEEYFVLGVCSEEHGCLKREAFSLTDIMYHWACQNSFAKVISKAQGFQEGGLVRWIHQLVEALNEIGSAARVMGDPAVPEKIQASIKLIKRGIVFSPSLYTTL